MKKVNLEVLKPWIGQKITQYLETEDEVVIGYLFSLLEEKVSKKKTKVILIINAKTKKKIENSNFQILVNFK